MKKIRILWLIVAVIAGFIGFVWFGQGIGVIHGSVMTNDTKWAVIGGLMVIGAVVIFWVGRPRKFDKG